MRYKKLVGAIALGMLVVIFFSYRSELLKLLEALQMNSTQNLGSTIAILISAKIVGAVTLLPGAPLTLLTGSILPFGVAVLTAWTGNLLGAIAAFYIGRYLFRGYLEEHVLPKYPRLGEFDKKMASKGLLTVIAIRLIPVFPFNIINYLLGITCVRARDYIIGTAIGLIPGTAAFVYLGNGLGARNPVTIGGAILGLAVLIYIGKKIDDK